MATFEEIAALRNIPEVDELLQKSSGLSLFDSVYEIYRIRPEFRRFERSAGIKDPHPYVFHESAQFYWMKVANPEATNEAIINAYETARQLDGAYRDCAEEITKSVGTKVEVTMRMQMAVDLLWSRYPMFSKMTIRMVDYEWFLGNR